MRNLTILQLLHGMSVGGAEVLAARLARRLQDRFRFVFACLDHVGELGEALKDEGFPLFTLDRRNGFDWGCAQRLRKLVQREHVDVIHAHQYTPFFYGLASSVFRARPPILFTEHGRFHPDSPRRKRILFNRTFLRTSDRVIAVGEAVRQAVIQNEGIPANRTGVIYNGIDLSRFEAVGDEDRRELRAELSLSESDFTAILVGRLDYLKDHLTAVRTAERVARQIPGFRMIFVGEGSERTKIEAEIERRHLQETVTLLGTRHDIPQLLAASDVCFLSSISEGIPLTLIEGMAASRPVVSTDVGGIAEIVVDRKTGLLAPAEDDASLAAHLITLANDADKRLQMGATGRERARQLFSEVEMHRQYADQFEEMTAKRGKRQSQPDAVAAM